MLIWTNSSLGQRTFDLLPSKCRSEQLHLARQRYRMRWTVPRRRSQPLFVVVGRRTYGEGIRQVLARHQDLLLSVPVVELGHIRVSDDRSVSDFGSVCGA